MVNLINFKSILLCSICIAGTIFVSSCSDNKTVDSKEVTEQKNLARLAADNKTMVVVENDVKFLMKATEMQLEEISLGKFAKIKGNSDHVVALGKMMEDDHTKAYNEVQALAQSKSVSIPTSVTEDAKDAYEKLDKKTGNDFGKAYSNLMVEKHEDAIKLFEKASTESEDPDIRAWASQKLPGLRMHLEHAEACKKECDKM